MLKRGPVARFVVAFLLVVATPSRYAAALQAAGFLASPQDLQEASEAVVRGRAFTTAVRRDHGLVFTLVTIEILDNLYGHTGSQLDVKLCGGEVEDGVATCEDEAKLPIGTEFVAFLTRWRTGEHRVTGGDLGVSRVSRETSGRIVLVGGVADGMSLDDLTGELQANGAAPRDPGGNRFSG